MEKIEMPPDFDVNVALVELDRKIDRLTLTVENITKQTNEMNEKLEKMNNIVFNPDEGLYARIKNQDTKITSLQEFKKTTNKGFWILLTSIVGIFSKFIVDFFTGV